MNDEVNDAASNPLSEDHLPVAGEIVEEDDQVTAEVLEDVNVE